MAYLPLSTANLPDPVIDPAQGSSPEDYFNTVLYTGNSSTNAITGVGFQPDFLWLKARSASGYDHVLQNVITGSTNQLYTNSTSAEVSDTDAITSFDADGFTSGADVTTNNSGVTYVAWNWKANGTGVSNTDGSITSTVSANTESGFSIVSYTGDGTTSHNVGHGLGVKPDMIIAKTRNAGSTRWVVAHKDIPTTNRLVLDDTFASAADGDRISAYDDTTFTHNWNGANSNTFIAYCFHSVEGFSKFGSYTGNGSTDGSFIYCGFKPSFIIVKRTNAAEDWFMYDNKRSASGGFNVLGERLKPNTSDSGYTTAYVDFLSNGFKWRVSGTGQNGSGDSYIFMAFADDGGAFKYSLAR